MEAVPRLVFLLLGVHVDRINCFTAMVTVLYSLVPEHANPPPCPYQCHCHSSCIYFPSLPLPAMVHVISAVVR